MTHKLVRGDKLFVLIQNAILLRIVITRPPQFTLWKVNFFVVEQEIYTDQHIFKLDLKQRNLVECK
jgi:hypothetical protein